MYQMTVYVKHIRTVGDALDHMGIPYLVKKSLSHYNIFEIAFTYASTEAVTMSVLAEKP